MKDLVKWQQSTFPWRKPKDDGYEDGGEDKKKTGRGNKKRA